MKKPVNPKKKTMREVSKIKPQGIKTRDVRNMNQSNMAIAIEDGDADYFRKEARIVSAANAANANRTKRRANAGPIKMQNKIKRLPDTVVKTPVNRPESKSKSKGLNPLPKKKGSPSSKKVNLPGKPGKPSRMINY
jgi:hypothetical protein